jgi:predicted transcriptional regulator
MPTPYLEAAHDLASLLGPREADIMRLVWTRGSATVRELHTWLIEYSPLAYTTLLTICTRLFEKGLLDRQLESRADKRTTRRKAHIYTPRVTEQEFARDAVRQQLNHLLTHYPALVEAYITGNPTLRRIGGGADRARVEHLLAYLGTLRDSSGQRVEDTALDMIAALLERAETAERAAATSQAEIQRAEQRSLASEQRAQDAELRTQTAERRAIAAEQRAATLPRKANNPKPKGRPILGPVYEHRGNICRVCARPAPPPTAARLNDLRVCSNEECRREAKRRDNLAKQRRYKERQRAHQAQVEQAISHYVAANSHP